MLDTALVLVAHGSHYNMASSEPARRHADRLRALGRWDQVVCACWKEFPSLRDVRWLVDAELTVVIPLFMAEGYFSQRVVPRELELDGPLTVRDGRRIQYTGVVGAHPRLADVTSRLAEHALGPAGPRPAETALVVVGHGTVQDRRSKETVLAVVERLRGHGWAEVTAAFLEEPPLVADVPRLVHAEQIVAVPLFVANGYHTTEDIPRDLGLGRGPRGWRNPSVVSGRRVWCTGAVGADPGLVDVIAELADDGREPPRPVQVTLPAWAKAFLASLPGDRATVLDQVLITPTQGGWDLRHVADAGAGVAPVADLLALVRTSGQGGYRNLPSAPDLVRGWCFTAVDDRALVAALETLYPAALALCRAEQQGDLPVVDWPQLARRQTGWQGLVKRLASADVQAAALVVCRDERCLRRVLWRVADEPAPGGSGAVPCAEPCSLFLAFAQRIARLRRGEPSGGGADPRWREWLAWVGVEDVGGNTVEPEPE